MRLERKLNLGGYQSMTFVSNDHMTVQECARDLIGQMQPLTNSYPVIKGAIEELRKAYNV